MNEKLEDVIDKKSNNLNLMKFIAAMIVILSHSYILSTDKMNRDPIALISNGELNLGSIGVALFFLSSGLLISRSVERNSKAINYFKARAVRIFPPLVITVLFCTFVIGPLFTSLDISSYMSNPNTYKYLLNSLFIPIHNLPGVFESNVYSSVVNGALWTMGIEFLCYIGVYILCKLKLMECRKMLCLAPLAIIIYFFIYYNDYHMITMIRPYMHPFFMFYIGVNYYVFREKIILSSRYAIISVLFTLFFILIKLPSIALFVFLPYLFVYLFYYKKQCNERIANLGLLSYCIYLVGFPIQQALVALYGGEMSIMINFIETILLSMVLGILLYLISEKPFHKKRESQK